MTTKHLLCSFSIFIALTTTSKGAMKTDSLKVHFEDAYIELKSMLEEKQSPNFEKAVFLEENAYWNNEYSYLDFQNMIDVHSSFIKELIDANDKSDSVDFSVKVNTNGRFNVDDLRYTPKQKKELYKKALENWAIFTYLTDSIRIYSFNHFPYAYASNDPFGMKDWSNSQVINLLASADQKGNCFALTAFFKILSDRLNSNARICTAPQHIYIQHQDQKGDFYNVELATAGHPGDGMIQTLTYTSSKAIESGVALRSYSDKESIGLCLVNLAKGYEHKFNIKDDEFILKCAELALKYDSLNLNALLLKLQVLDERVTNYASKKNIINLNKLKADHNISKTLYKLENQLSTLYRLGYRQMPLDMQEMVLKGFQNEEATTFSSNKNPSPFTSFKPKDKNDESYWTLSQGTLQEVFEDKKEETFGHFTFDTETKTIESIDTTNKKDFIIDPVAFAYDFGARIYDARLGRFTSVDPMVAKYPGYSPYAAFNNNPIYYIDPDGKEGVGAVDHTNKTITLKAVYFLEIGKSGFTEANYKQLQGVNATLNSKGYTVTDEKNSLHGYTVQFDLQFVPVTSDKTAQSFAESEKALTESNATGGVNLTEGGLNIGNSMILTDNATFESNPSIKGVAEKNNVGPEKVLGITDASLQHINIPSKSQNNVKTQLHEIFHTLYFNKDGATNGIGSGSELPSPSDINELIKGVQDNNRVIEDKK